MKEYEAKNARAALAAFDIWLGKFDDKEAERIGNEFNELLDKNMAKFVRDYMNKIDNKKKEITLVKS